MIDNRFRHGLSWLDEDEDEDAAKLILKAIYRCIYDEHQNSTVVRSLLEAYDQQKQHDDVDAKPLTLCGLCGDFAFAYMQQQYCEAIRPILTLYKVNNDQDGCMENFWWPESLPENYPIRRGILKSVARRMAVADAYTARELKRHYEAEKKEGT